MNDMAWVAPGGAEFIEDDGADAPGRDIRKGLMIGAAFFVGLLGFAALTPLDAGANAEGVVAVSGSRQAVQHQQGGIVTDIRVTEGQAVRKGDIILMISASDAVAIERGLTSDYIAAIAQRARLLAEQNGRSTIPEPKEFAGLSAEDRLFASEALGGQRQLLTARANALAAERGVLRQRMAQHAEQIGGFTYQMRSNREQTRLIGEELEGLRALLPKGYVSLNRVREMERAAAELDGSHGAYRSEIARASEAIGEARIQSLSLDKTRLEEVAGQMREVQIRIDEIMPKLSAVREQLARSIVRAPASGRVVGLKVFTVGGVVSAGDVLMEIVPQDRALVIEGKVSPTDADDLSPGMETQVRFSALQERNLPILHGRLTKISADSFEDQRTGIRYFKIEAIVPPGELAKLELIRRGGALKAGLPAQVLIPLRKRTALDYLVEPLTQSLWKAGREH
jgi:HlyD family type I secretion membrane fusion protein